MNVSSVYKQFRDKSCNRNNQIIEFTDKQKYLSFRSMSKLKIYLNMTIAQLS